MLRTRFLRLIHALLACTAVLAASRPAGAQTPVRPGSFVRILAPSVADSLLTGTVVEIDSASLLLAPPAWPGSRTVALRDIERLEVRVPGPSTTLAGVLRWVVAGAMVGYAVCHAASGSPHSNCPRAGGAAAGGTVGLLLGVEIGDWPRAKRWRPVPAPGRPADSRP